MAVASVVGLILPGLDEASPSSVGAGVAVGAGFLLGVRGALEARQRHLHRAMSAGLRASILVFVVLLVHSLPEGFAIGTAYASDTVGLSLFVIVAIAIQNIPEGTSVAIPMAAASLTLSSVLGRCRDERAQPAGAAITFLLVEEIEPLLPFRSGSRPARCLRWWWSSCSRTRCAAAGVRRHSARRWRRRTTRPERGARRLTRPPFWFQSTSGILYGSSAIGSECHSTEGQLRRPGSVAAARAPAWVSLW